jgi:F420-dependent oxidoreductase-like protein
MRLGLNLGRLGAGRAPADMARLAREADRLGFSVVWVGEAQGSEAPSLLAWLAAQTTSVDLGAAVMQIPGRSPALAAMTAATVDALSGGRFRLGLGTSGAQLSEGWHGVPFGAPLARTREYVEIVRMVLAGQGAEYAGEHYALPMPGGPGKVLRLGMRPVRDRVPVHLAALGPRSLELAGEIADGWLALFLDPGAAAGQLDRIRAGRRRAGRDLSGFDVDATVPLAVGDDVALCAGPARRFCALYLGGMGSREQNFYNRLAARMGYAEAAAQVQDRFLAGRVRAAAEAVPLEFVDRTSLLGPVDRIARRLREYAAAGVTNLSVMPLAGGVDDDVRALHAVSEALVRSGAGTPVRKSGNSPEEMVAT